MSTHGSLHVCERTEGKGKVRSGRGEEASELLIKVEVNGIMFMINGIRNEQTKRVKTSEFDIVIDVGKATG